MTGPFFRSNTRYFIRALACLMLILLFSLGRGSSLCAEPNGWRPEIRAVDQANGPPTPAAQPVTPEIVNVGPGTADTPTLPEKPTAGQKRQMAMEGQTQDNTATRAADAERLETEERNSRESLAERYCRVAVDAAAAAKLREEAKKAELVKAEIEGKLTELEAAVSKLQNWLQRREDFKNRATDNLVTVYAQMDAEAAAQRLVLVGEQTAAAILMKLPAKNASAVLGEMQPEMASKITSYMAGAAAVNTRNDLQAGAPR